MWTFGLYYICNLSKDKFSQRAHVQSVVVNAYYALRQMSYVEKGMIR